MCRFVIKLFFQNCDFSLNKTVANSQLPVLLLKIIQQIFLWMQFVFCRPFIIFVVLWLVCDIAFPSPSQYGLYSSFMGCFIYCFLGTSKDVTLGPTAIMSLLVSSYAFHDPDLAVLLAFLSGCIQLAMGLLHLGKTWLLLYWSSKSTARLLLLAKEDNWESNLAKK